MNKDKIGTKLLEAFNSGAIKADVIICLSSKLKDISGFKPEKRLDTLNMVSGELDLKFLKKVSEIPEVSSIEIDGIMEAVRKTKNN